jgi:hypothetical protein
MNASTDLSKSWSFEVDDAAKRGLCPHAERVRPVRAEMLDIIRSA